MRWVRAAFVICVLGGALQTGHLRVPEAIARPAQAQYWEWRGHQDREARDMSCRIHVLRADRGSNESQAKAEQCLPAQGRESQVDADTVVRSLGGR